MRLVLSNVRRSLPLLLLLSMTSSSAQKRVVDLLPLHDIPSLLRVVNATGLLRWEEHVMGLPLCPKEVPVLGGEYFIDDLQRIQFEPATCRIQRLSAREARLCLKDAHLAFIGDSLTRYQYISLAYFLSKMHHMDPFGKKKGQPSFVIEKEHSSWDAFYRESNAALETARNGCADERCDCERYGQNRDASMLNGEIVRVREIRHLDLKFPYPCGSQPPTEKQQQLAVSYFQVLGPPFGGSSLLAINAEAVSHYLTSSFIPAPTHVVYNQGIWLHGQADYLQTLDQIMTGAVSLRDRHNATLLWKTTTSAADGEQLMYDEEKPMAQARGMLVTDVSYLSMTAYRQGLTVHWDNMHFLPFMYEQFNELLLHQLCTPD